MSRALYIAATGMRAQQLNIDVVANNLANVNTAGFKRSRADFQDLLYQVVTPAGVSSSQGSEIPTGIALGYGSKPAAVQKLFTVGDMQPTDQPLDLAIEGDGFFQVTLANGEIGYTRAGSFKQDSSGQICTSEGNVLSSNITIPPDGGILSVLPDGTVTVKPQGQPETQIGNIQTARFLNPAGLQAIGHNLYSETTASGASILGTPGNEGYGTIMQGFIELSNVSIVDELVNMIVGQRAYEINSKAIQTADDMMRVATDLKR